MKAAISRGEVEAYPGSVTLVRRLRAQGIRTAGGFGLVIGVDRGGSRDALRAQGADVVVTDLGELVS